MRFARFTRTGTKGSGSSIRRPCRFLHERRLGGRIPRLGARYPRSSRARPSVRYPSASGSSGEPDGKAWLEVKLCRVRVALPRAGAAEKSRPLRELGRQVPYAPGAGWKRGAPGSLDTRLLIARLPGGRPPPGQGDVDSRDVQIRGVGRRWKQCLRLGHHTLSTVSGGSVLSCRP